MSQYTVYSAESGFVFGTYEGETPEAAIEACCRDAGYTSQAEGEASTETRFTLAASPVTDAE